MIGIGLLAALIALVALWVLWRSRLQGAPLGISLTGWLAPGAAVVGDRAAAAAAGRRTRSAGSFTEMGRQPWLVFGQMKTAAGVSANSAGEVLDLADHLDPAVRRCSP